MGKYMTTKEASEKWDISPRRINVLCKNERLPGAYKENKQWFIPVDAEKPADKRMKEDGFAINTQSKKIKQSTKKLPLPY